MNVIEYIFCSSVDNLFVRKITNGFEMLLFISKD